MSFTVDESTDRILDLQHGPVRVRLDGPSKSPPLLLIHGSPCSLEWFDQLTSLLCDTYRIVRIDLRGHGATGGRERLGRMDQVAMVTEVLDHLGITEISAVAHSFGTDIPIDLATAGRANAVVLIDQAPDFRCATYPPGLITLSRPSLIAIAQRAPAFAIQQGSKQGFAPGFRFDSVPGFAEIVVRDFRAFTPSIGRFALVDRARELAADPLDARIQRLDVPVLAIHGRRDQMYACAPSIARYSAAGARTAIIENAGHSPHVEAPEAVAVALRDFLD
ncbi:alpha/beta fold hydrolase [Nocardia sp. NPDC058666]|uniref:alpha/beta fold hydrolase n=1 Tax=Nocardia sp. NPDC058666 TaxID=3346587 RepID=UPI0036536E0E